MAIELRPEVRAFAEAMETKLRKHDGERGQSWKETDINRLVTELQRHVWKLVQTLDLIYGADDLRRRILFAAADVGNFAMMIADASEQAIDEAVGQSVRMLAAVTPDDEEKTQ